MTTTDLRCPQCGALVRTDLLWCGLCHADLRPPAPATDPAELQANPVQPNPVQSNPVQSNPVQSNPYAAPQAAPAPAPAPAVAPRTGGKHARPAPVVPPVGSVSTGASALDTSDLPPEVLAQLGLSGPAPDLASGDLESAFAMLRAEHRDPTLSRIQAATATGGGKVALIAGGAVALTGLILLVLFVVGAVAV